MKKYQKRNKNKKTSKQKEKLESKKLESKKNKREWMITLQYKRRITHVRNKPVLMVTLLRNGLCDQSSNIEHVCSHSNLY